MRYWRGAGLTHAPARNPAASAPEPCSQQALQVVDDLGERVCLPQLLLLEAAIERGRDRAEAAAAAVRPAIDEAQAQRAPWLELHALVELCEHRQATPGEILALEARVARMPQAAETAAVARAQSLVARLKPA